MARPRRSDRAQKQGGVALVAVLLLVAGLIAVAVAVVTLSVSQRRSAQRAYEADVRRELLDGALRVALVEITNGDVDGPFWHPRMPRDVSIGGKHVEVVVEREAGRIDLNTADPKYLIAAIVGGGKTEEQARIAAARIHDWKDADDQPSPGGGAERKEYAAAKLPYEPRNGPFETVEEIRQVVGLGDLTDEQLDSFTVYSQQLEPSPGDAPESVRTAIAWLSKAAGEGGVNVLPAPASLPDAMQPVSYAGTVVRMRACLKDERESPCRVTVQRITGSSRQPFHVFLWR